MNTTVAVEHGYLLGNVSYNCSGYCYSILQKFPHAVYKMLPFLVTGWIESCFWQRSLPSVTENSSVWRQLRGSLCFRKGMILFRVMTFCHLNCNQCTLHQNTDIFHIFVNRRTRRCATPKRHQTISRHARHWQKSDNIAVIQVVITQCFVKTTFRRYVHSVITLLV